MTTRTTRESRRTTLRVTELERRDTPAWWSVAAPVPAEGVVGTTDATHAGSLTLNPDYDTSSGTVTVWADTAIEAAILGINGTITVTLLGESVDYVFNPETVGTTVADHKAFLVVADGGGVSVSLEDMAGAVSCDWDYDDRTWGGAAAGGPGWGDGKGEGGGAGGGLGGGRVTVGGAANPILFEGNSTWTGGSGNATVHQKVESLSPTVYKWDYVVRNDSFQSSFSAGLGIGASGIGRVRLPSLSKDQVFESYSSRGGVVLFSQPTGGGVGEAVFSFGVSQPNVISVGQSAEFWMTTAPRPVTPSSGVGEDFGALWYTSGPAVGPGDDGVQVVITDRFGTPIGTVGPDGPNTLKVAKWENAFNIAGNVARVKPVSGNSFNIIDLDDDRFNIWVYDKAKWDANTQHAWVKISTDNVIGFTDYNDNATVVDMVRYTGTAKDQGWFWSDSQLLVSNNVDDISAIPGVGVDDTNSTWKPLDPLKHGYQWRQSDRTHRIALRGTVKAEYTPDGGVAVSDTKAVPMRHYVDAHVTILNAPDGNGVQTNKGVVTIQEADADFRRANEQYAQVGILIVPRYDADVAWPINVDGRVDLSNGFDGISRMDPLTGKAILTGEEKALLYDAANSPSLDEIEVYYVNYFYASIASGGVPRRGEAIMSSISPSPGYTDSVVIAARDRPTSPFTLAHEIGHVLTDRGHVTNGVWPVNLMRSGTSSVDDLDSSKRLTESQDGYVHTERVNLLK